MLLVQLPQQSNPKESHRVGAGFPGGGKPVALLVYHICVWRLHLHSASLSDVGMSKCLTLMVECAVVLQLVMEACSRQRRPGETSGMDRGEGREERAQGKDSAVTPLSSLQNTHVLGDFVLLQVELGS